MQGAGQGDEVGVEGQGFNAPDAGPLHRAAFLAGEAFTRLLGLGIHAGEHGRIEVTLVERQFATAHDGGDDAGEGLEAADSANGVGVLAGNGADFEGQFGGGSQSVPAKLHRRRAGVRFLPLKSDGVTLDALGTGDYPQRKAQAFEHRPLFDVEFEIGGDVGSLAGGFGKTVDRDAAAGERVFESNTVFVGAAAVRFDGVRAGEGGGAQQAAAEARAFFVGPIDQLDGERRAALLSEGSEDFEGGEDAEASV